VSLEEGHINQVILSKKDGEEFVKFNSLMTNNVQVLLCPLFSHIQNGIALKAAGYAYFSFC
jgi:hypothetical protein